jgi:maltose O-acetyltransferase
VYLLWLKFVNLIQGMPIVPRRARRLLLYIWGLDVHSSELMDGIYFGGTDIEIGRGTLIRHGCELDNNARISIGENVSVGPDVQLLTSGHEIGPRSKRLGKLFGSPIVVGNGVWIGARVTVMPGVTIGNGCVIGAGSLVAKDCEPNCVYVGVPARKLKEID